LDYTSTRKRLSAPIVVTRILLGEDTTSLLLVNTNPSGAISAELLEGVEYLTWTRRRGQDYYSRSLDNHEV